jgi:hypothetical protein
VFAKRSAGAPMVSEDAGRLEAMGKAIRKLYGPSGRSASDGARDEVLLPRADG